MRERRICNLGNEELDKIHSLWVKRKKIKFPFYENGKIKEWIQHKPKKIIVLDKKTGEKKTVNAIVINDSKFTKDFTRKHAIDLEGNKYIYFQGFFRKLKKFNLKKEP